MIFLHPEAVLGLSNAIFASGSYFIYGLVIVMPTSRTFRRTSYLFQTSGTKVSSLAMAFQETRDVRSVKEEASSVEYDQRDLEKGEPTIGEEKVNKIRNSFDSHDDLRRGQEL
jgi:hypothetical protein